MPAHPTAEVRAYFSRPNVISGKLTIGASGAVTKWEGYGVESVTKHAQTAGHYTFVLDDMHGALIGASVMQVAATAADITAQILSEDVDNATKASRTIVVQLKAAATEADAASGSVLLCTFIFADSKKLGFGPART